jgi:WD40 repeat protein
VWAEDFRFEIFDPANGESIRTLGVTGGGMILSVAWSLDGTTIGSDSGDDNLIRLWDAATGKMLGSLAGHTEYVTDIDWSSDGKLASASKDSTVIIWNISTKQPILKLHADRYLWRVRWSPDGRFLAGVPTNIDNPHTAYIWDAATGQLVSTIESKVGNVHDVSWSPDGTQLAYVGEHTGAKGENLQIIPAPASTAPEATSTAEAGGG